MKIFVGIKNTGILQWICIYFIKRKIDKIIKHTDSKLLITFGSSLTKNPCEASFAIDDLVIYIN